MSEQDRGFEVRDKRKINREDEAAGRGEEARPDEKPAAGQEPAGEKGPVEGAAEAGDTGEKQKAGAGGEKPGPEGSGAKGGALPPLDFISFTGSLAATAFMHLGEKISPDQPDMPKDLAAAKQMIDLIELLKVKTEGNLETDEARMLESILYNLRMRYVMETKKQ